MKEVGNNCGRTQQNVDINIGYYTYSGVSIFSFFFLFRQSLTLSTCLCSLRLVLFMKMHFIQSLFFPNFTCLRAVFSISIYSIGPIVSAKN